ncbi:acyl- thioesterase ii [Trichoderma arundinaceum]|uniref:Acyl-thioesterase ii n=1 Tax=Trichoderma arundinaceum TaxID=490622 RepID=A0A395NIU0_TRIAR|nr:acyl- thioesterase ii [Trichoderma arundinaceum]
MSDSDNAAPKVEGTEKVLDKRTTLLRPPEPDPNKAPIENTVEVTPLEVLGEDIFTNTRPLWLPPGARGVYGGAVIAQCLAAAQLTVKSDFLVHSCHCYFLLAGSPAIPIMYHVERVRDGRSFATRTVQARQKGKCIFTTTISFVREASGGVQQINHAAALPDDVEMPKPNWDDEDPIWDRAGPFQSRRIELLKVQDPETRPDQRKTRQWHRCRGKISVEGGHQAHLNALAYISDSYFIGTVSRIHRLWRLGLTPEQVVELPEERRKQLQEFLEFEGMGSKLEDWIGRPKVGMLVSLDHSIYFHEPKRVRADEWMFSEIESPWSGDGRGVVMQRIYAQDGTLLASCMQEGVVECETYPSLNTWGRIKGCPNKTKVVKFVFGWCKKCEAVVAPIRSSINLRDPLAIRRCWEHKAFHRLAKPLSAPTGAAEIHPAISYFESFLYQEPDDPRGVTWEELTIERELRSLKPGQVWLGLRKYDYPCSDEELLDILRWARVWTLVWANGDERLNEEDPMVPLVWSPPHHENVWRLTRSTNGEQPITVETQPDRDNRMPNFQENARSSTSDIPNAQVVMDSDIFAGRGAGS